MPGNLKSALLSSIALGSIFVVSAARADDTAAEIAMLKAELRRLEARVAAQDRQVRQTKVVVQDVAGRPIYTKGPPLPAFAACPPDKFCYKGVTITPGGFVAMETVFRDHATGGDVGTPYGNLGFNNLRTQKPQELRFSARQSRISGLVEGDVNPAVHLSGYGEFDFLNNGGSSNYNESNSWAPRIRHLYAQVDQNEWGFHFLAGQTWSLATMFATGLQTRKENIPLTIDAQYVPGFIWARQAQLRAVQDFGNLHVGVSAESSQTIYNGSTTPSFNGLPFLVSGTGNGNNGGGILSPSFDHAPDIIGKVAYDTAFFGDRKIHLEGYGVGRDFYARYAGNQEETFTGFGGGSALVSLFPKLLDAQISGAYGQGIGRYGTSQLPDITVGPTGNISPLTEYALLAGVTLHATPQLDIYGYAGREEVEGKNLGVVGGNPYGYGNFALNVSGCVVESAATCNAQARRVDQVTVGAWYDIYKGPYGNLRGGAQYSYTEKTAFSGRNGATAAAPQYTPRSDDNIFLTSLRYYPF